MENQPTVTKNWMIGAIYATYYNKELLVAVVFLCGAGDIGEQGCSYCAIEDVDIGGMHLVRTQAGGREGFGHWVRSKGKFIVTMTSYCVQGGGEGVKNGQKLRTY